MTEQELEQYLQNRAQQGIVLAKSHLGILGIALVIILALGAAAGHLYVAGIKAEAARDVTIALKAKENEQLQREKEKIAADAASTIASLEQQKKATRTPRQAAAVLATALPPTLSDPNPVTQRDVPSTEDPTKTKTETVFSPEAIVRLAQREFSCQQSEVAATSCKKELAIDETKLKNTNDQLDAALKVSKPGFFRRFWTVTKIAAPAAAIGIVIGVILHHGPNAKLNLASTNKAKGKLAHEAIQKRPRDD